MTQSAERLEVDSIVPSSLGRHLRKWATRSLNQLPVVRKVNPVLRSGVRDTFRGLQEGDRLVQMMGWVLIGAGIYQQWKRLQTPSLLYSAYLDTDESVGIRVLQKGNIVGEFPVGRSGG